jgi:hypothetical protein
MYSITDKFNHISNKFFNKIPKHLSKDFIKKLNLCKNNLDETNFGWIYYKLLASNSVIEIAYIYLKKSKYNGDYFFDFNSELFNAFCYYKNNSKKYYNYNIARYLCLKNGILAINTNSYLINDSIFTILTIKDIILELDGNGFINWLNESTNKINSFNVIDSLDDFNNMEILYQNNDNYSSDIIENCDDIETITALYYDGYDIDLDYFSLDE